MASPQILFVLDERDNHRELVLPHLTAEPIIFEPADIPEGHELSFVQDNTKEYAVIGDTVLDNVQSIWWRKMLELSTTKVPADALEKTYGNPTFSDYAVRSVRRHANALGAFFTTARWVSNPYSMHRAENKAWQLRVAHDIGMSVPRTLQTSSASLAKRFVKAQKNGCIVKSLSSHFPVTPDGRELMFWSQRIDGKHNVSFDGLDVAPAIFQQAIDGFDVRVTVVGTTCFAAKIIKQTEPGAIRDWRVIGQGVTGKPRIEPYDLPKELAKQCATLLQKMDLRYGAIDFVVDTKGTHWFLEINTMGAWGFIEEDTGLPIGKAMADLLCKPTT